MKIPDGEAFSYFVVCKTAWQLDEPQSRTCWVEKAVDIDALGNKYRARQGYHAYAGRAYGCRSYEYSFAGPFGTYGEASRAAAIIERG